MKEEAYRKWLDNDGQQDTTTRDHISQIKRIERAYGDIFI